MTKTKKKDDVTSSEKREKQVEFYHLCSECQTGILRLEHLTYFTWLNEELITVPNFPAWVCDVCGRREYDTRAVMRLNTLLRSEGKRKPVKRSRRRPGSRRADRPLP
jgi:YgiT-type zinc finger domain-containing protein